MVRPWRSVFAITILLVFATAVLAEESTGTKPAGRVLVEMKDDTITVEEFQQTINELPGEGRKKVDQSRARERFLDELIRERLFVREARRLKMNERSDVAAEIEDAIAGVLARSYLKEQLAGKIRVTDAEIRAYMDENPRFFQTPERVRLRQILIQVNRGAGESALAAARKKAEGILTKVKAGEDFVRLVERYSEDKRSRRRGGDLDYVKKGKMGEAFDAVVFKLKPGDVSSVLRVRHGFAIVKVEDKQPAAMKTMKEARPFVTNKLQVAKESAAVESLTQELMKRYEVKVHKDLLKAER